MSSNSSRIGGITPYCPSKAAVKCLRRQMALELAKRHSCERDSSRHVQNARDIAAGTINDPERSAAFLAKMPRMPWLRNVAAPARKDACLFTLLFITATAQRRLCKADP